MIALNLLSPQSLVIYVRVKLGRERMRNGDSPVSGQAKIEMMHEAAGVQTIKCDPRFHHSL